MKYTNALWVGVALAAYGMAGCGGEHHEAHHGGEPGGEHAEHHEMKGPVGELHAVLAPIWHSEKTPERITKACEQAATMKERSAAVESGAAPEGANVDGFKAAAKDMTAAADALVAACAADGRPEAEAKFVAFHDAFHKVMDQGDAKHEEHHQEHHDEPKK